MATKNSKKTIETGHNSNVHKAINLRPVSNRSTFPYWAKINIPQKMTRAKGSKFLPKKEKQKLRLNSFNLWINNLHVKPLNKGEKKQVLIWFEKWLSKFCLTSITPFASETRHAITVSHCITHSINAVWGVAYA